MVDPHQVQDGGMQVVEVHRVFLGVVAVVVGAAELCPGTPPPAMNMV